MSMTPKLCKCGRRFMTSKVGVVECSKCRRFGHVKMTGLARRRQREAEAEGSHTEGQWRYIIRQQGELCYWCHRSMRDKNFVLHATKDHLMPLSRGGGNAKDNIVAACWPCNREKHNRTPGEYRVYLAQRGRRFFNLSTVPAYADVKKAESETQPINLKDIPNELRQILAKLADGKKMEPVRADIDLILAQKRRLCDELERRKLLSPDKTRLIGWNQKRVE